LVGGKANFVAGELLWGKQKGQRFFERAGVSKGYKAVMTKGEKL
jgi:hypothetical protein